MAIKYPLNQQKVLSVREARAQFSTLVSECEGSSVPIIITKYGRPIAAIVSTNTTGRRSKNHAEKVALASSYGMWKDKGETTEDLAKQLRLKAERQ